MLHAVFISALLGLLISALVLIWGRPLISLIGGREAALDEALAYAGVAFADATAIWLLNAFASSLRGASDMQKPSLTLLLVGRGLLVRYGAPVGSMFAHISAAMLIYGVVTALTVYYVRWGD